MSPVDGQLFKWTASDRLIPFEPTSADALDARGHLRALMETLQASPGQVLHGVVSGPGVAGTDLDNALLYNVGGSQAGATRHGVALERHAGGGPGVRYGYRLTDDPSAGVSTGEQIVRVPEASLPGHPASWLDIWAAVRRAARIEVVQEAPADRELALRVTVGAPSFRGSANGEFVKRIIDGITTALHESSALVSTDAAERLASRARLDTAKIAELLQADDNAVLGETPGLIVARGPGVQCRPRDDRISVLRIELDRTSTRWSLDATLSAVAAG
ncbi:MAG: hypothetical protein JHD16_00960 [Solirubrobacteraceae bacterium]|nr:hypothetical protein [Solirubrobacteraceae bacterium]